ncbi:MAG: transcriptional regulator [Methanobrevibacter sp.]|uniref:transcriptional regulator n=1 Tax=Methanobrevibacter sp. TaxID=66852 RepID=UPI0025DA2BEC|nr:transcriptional regulator [Methanobrevibacter sp.]MBQ8017851.1 transcriptional regulator [Methanobrevibacter sp.]
MDKETEAKLIRYIQKSTYRHRAFKAIGRGVKMPKEIAEDSGILQNHVSNVLRQLKEKEVVECLNPKVRKGRLYRLSEDGLRLLDKVD